MSHDRKTICPNCVKNLNRQFRMLEEQYGKVSQSDYFKLVEQALRDRGIYFDEDNPEDLNLIEYGATVTMSEDGSLLINYSCECTRCRWTYKYDKVVQVLDTGSDD